MNESTERDIVAIKNEISRLTALIEKRQKWLSDPVNRRRGTWQVVLRDTRQMEETLDELQHELANRVNH